MERVAFSLGEAFFGPGDHYLKGAGGLGMLVSVLLSNAVVIAGIVLVFLIIFAGIQMITGSGEPEKLDRARQIITAGIIGFILIISGFFIVRFLESSLGIDLLRGDPPAERLMCSDYSSC